MRLTFLLPGPLQPLAGGRADVALVGEAATVGEALAALWSAHPALKDRVMTEDGRLRPHVNVFVGRQSIRFTGGLATAVYDGAEVAILPAVSGG
jgi:molybdopterin converting factor small subunit